MFFKTKQTDSAIWSAVVFGSGLLSLAEVERRTGLLPRVCAQDVFACDGGEGEALKRLKSAGRVGRRRCSTLLGHGQYQMLQVDVPDGAGDLQHAELCAALRWRVKEMVDFPVDQAGVDVLEIPAAGSRASQLWVVAAAHDVLRPRIRLFQDAKVPLEAIDIPELAQRNLANLFEDDNRGVALVAFDTQENGSGRLTISFQGELFVIRHLDASGPALARPDAEALHERVLLDIQRTLDNFDRNYSAIPLTRLLVGPLPGGDHFLAYLGAHLTLPVERADLAKVLDISAAPGLADAAVQAQNWLTLGAALRD